MPHISTKQLKTNILNGLHNQLLGLLQKSNKSSSTKIVLAELLTETEKIMITKRLAIILMLNKKVPQHVICEKLLVSPSTVAKTSLSIEVGKYDYILQLSDNNINELSDLLEKILLAGMPPMGRKRWSFLDKYK